MREKIAAAMYGIDVLHRTAFRNQGIESGNSSPHWVDWRDVYLRRADAALDALMEPDDNMVIAGLNNQRTGSSDSDVNPYWSEYRKEMANIFRAMILAAKAGA